MTVCHQGCSYHATSTIVIRKEEYFPDLVGIWVNQLFWFWCYNMTPFTCHPRTRSGITRLLLLQSPKSNPNAELSVTPVCHGRFSATRRHVLLSVLSSQLDLTGQLTSRMKVLRSKQRTGSDELIFSE